MMTQKPSKRRPAAEQDKLIVAALKAAGRPVSAYEIIDRVRGDASLAPQTVYRALDRLISAGVAHRQSARLDQGRGIFEGVSTKHDAFTDKAFRNMRGHRPSLLGLIGDGRMNSRRYCKF